MRVRRSVYWKFGKPITLAFISGIDAHPELLDDAPPSAPPQPQPEPKTLRPPRWSDRTIRRMMGKDRKQAARVLDQVRFETTMTSIMREGA